MWQCLVGLWLLGSPAEAAEHRQEVLDLLNAHGAFDPEQVSQLGVVEAELIAIAEDPEVPRSRRGRAVSALGRFPTETVRGWLSGQVQDAAGDTLIRRKAAWSLASAFGDTAVPALAEALGDDDVQLRIATARALGELDSDVARTALRNRLQAESEAEVRDVINTSLEER